MASLIERYGWHEWLCKTNFSFLLGASHPAEIITKAHQMGYASIAINDFDGAYGLARCYRELKKLDSPLKLHYGAEVHLSLDHQLPTLLQKTIVLIACSWQGYYNLNHILTLAHKNGKHHAHILLHELLKQDVRDIVAIQPMRGDIRQVGNHPHLIPLKEHFNEHLYLAISRHLHLAEDLWIHPTISLAKQLEVPLLCCQDAFFHDPTRKNLSDILHAIRTNKAIQDCPEHLFPNTERYLRPLPELEALFSKFPFYEQSLLHASQLSSRIDFCFSMLRYFYPKEMIPDGFTAQEYLECIAWQHAKKKYRNQIPAKVSQRVHHELELIGRLQFADYFLTVWDIVRWARSQGILCQGRGSAANSAVCFVLGITSVDPSLFDLLFERFISAERGDPPDIDVDFEHERREEVVQYIYRRYGRGRATMVANVITFRRKGTLRAAGKGLGIPESILNETAKLCQSKHQRGRSVEHIIDQVRQRHPTDQVPTAIWKAWTTISRQLKGFPRHLGIHSGGFILSDRALCWLAPQEPATMVGRTVLQWCKEDIEGLGFFKIDILCLGMLTAVRKCFHYIAEFHHRHLTMDSIPQGDERTYKMIQRADTVGTFQIESRAQMSMLPRLKPREFYDLVIEIAIIRPGPIQGKVIHPYLKRRNGEEPITFPDERLRPILSRTLGVTIFQEQLMRVAMAVGNFSPGEANELRRMIGAWSVKELSRNLEPMLEKLVTGMRQNGLSESFIKQITGQMRGFADYGFPESHAVSFALIAYVSCFLKYYYPAAFFSSVLNSQPMGFYTPHSLLQAARRDGVSIRPICINHSYWDCTLEQTHAPDKPALRLGFRLVTGLRKEHACTLVTARQRAGGSFKDLSHLLQFTVMYRHDLTALAAANALATFGWTRNEALWLAQKAPICPHLEDVEDRISWPQETVFERTERDFSAFGTTLGDHPAKLIRTSYWFYPAKTEQIILANQLTEQRRAATILTFGMITVKQAPPSAKGMVFLTLEDETGFINLVFTPQIYAKVHETVENQAFLCTRGTLQLVDKYASIMVHDVLQPSKPQAEIFELSHATHSYGGRGSKVL